MNELLDLLEIEIINFQMGEEHYLDSVTLLVEEDKID